mmetsp:Transcript_98411/g.179735  ORF Transcript_98411/g.179735 Transcript_98411/m.179735 type:complete len:342 (+) Transcript_98411:14-1039(+)
MALALQVFNSAELSLLLSSFMTVHSCWCMSGVSKTTFSPSAVPQLHKALAWRQKLGELFGLVDVVLTLYAPSAPTARELSNAVTAFTGREFTPEQLGQLLAIGTGMLWTHKLAGGTLVVSQQDNASGRHKLPFEALWARWERFEAAMASLTEDLASSRVPQQQLQRPSTGGRRLSRQASMVVPKEVPKRELGERTTSYQQAVAAKEQSERSLRIAQGGESARCILEQLFAKSGYASLDRVVQALTSRKSNLRQGPALAADEAPAALMLLAIRTSGGLSIETNQSCRQQIRFCCGPFDGVSTKAVQRSLQKDFASLQGRHQQYCTDAKRAFIATLDAPVSDD